MNQHEDHRYLIALRENHSETLRELYANHSAQVIRWVMNNNGSMADAKDVFQEALLALYNKACDPDFVLTYPIGGLIFQICKNKWIDQIRKKRKESEVRIVEKERYTTEESISPLIEQVEEEEIRQKKLDIAFKQLSELCQKLLGLVSEGIASKDIAVALQMNDANTVYRRKSACVDRWRALYKL